MDKIIDTVNKWFDNYDFFALWGAGAIVIVYNIAMHWLCGTLDLIVELNFSIIEENGLLIFVSFMLLSYFLGLVLHELGRVFCEIKIQSLSIFRVESIIDLKTGKIFTLSCSNRYALWLCKKRITNFENSLKNDFPDIKLEDTHSVQYMEWYISLCGQSNGKKYSSFGLARSIFVGMVISTFLFILFGIVFQPVRIRFWIILVCSIVICFSMYGRTFKSYLAYLRNTYMRYCMAVIENHKIRVNKKSEIV